MLCVAVATPLVAQQASIPAPVSGGTNTITVTTLVLVVIIAVLLIAK